MSDWLNKARYLNAPKERTQKKFSSSWRFRVDFKDPEPKDILLIKKSFPDLKGEVEELPFLQLRKHYFYDPMKSKFRSFACGRNYGKNCHACHRQYDKGDKRLTARTANLWPAVHLDWYYRVENEYGDKPYFIQPENRSQEREFDDLDTHVKVFGAPKFLELGNSHQEMLYDILGNVVSECVGCLEHDQETNGNIEVVGWGCKSCGIPLEEIETTTLGRDEWRTFGQRKVSCHSCGYKGLPKEMVGCSQCPTPIRAEIYDVVLPLVKQGQGKDKSINLAYGKMPTYIDEYDVTQPDGSKAPLLDRLDGPNRIFNEYLTENVLKYMPDLKDLHSIEADLEFQEEIIND